MKIFDNLSKKTKTGVIISMVLSVFLLLNSGRAIINNIGNGVIRGGIIACLGFAVVLVIVWYTIFGYKQPHGNSLRFAYFAFAMYTGLVGITYSTGSEKYGTGVLMLLASLIIAYVSGRLSKIEKNKKLLVLVGLLFLADTVICCVSIGSSLTIPRVIGQLTPMGYHLALGFAYTARYEQHKEAGLEDK